MRSSRGDHEGGVEGSGRCGSSSGWGQIGVGF